MKNVIDLYTKKPITKEEISKLDEIETVNVIHVDGIFYFGGTLENEDIPDFLSEALNAYEHGEDLEE